MASSNTQQPADKVNALLKGASAKTKTITFRVEVKHVYTQEFTYDDFVELREMEFDVRTGTQEEFDAKMLPLWLAFLAKHEKEGIALEEIEEPESDAKEEDDFCLRERYGVDDELREIVNKQ